MKYLVVIEKGLPALRNGSQRVCRPHEAMRDGDREQATPRQLATSMIALRIGARSGRAEKPTLRVDAK